MRAKKAKAIRRIAKAAAASALLKHTDMRPDEFVSPAQVKLAVRRMTKLIKKQAK